MPHRLQLPRTRLISGLNTVIVVLALFALSTTPSFAESATSKIQITVGEAVKISKIDDWTLGVHASADTIPYWNYHWDYQCVYSTTGLYSVTVSSRNGGNRLQLVSQNGDRMNYEIWGYVKRGGFYQWAKNTAYTTSEFTVTGLTGSRYLDCRDEYVYGPHNLLWAPLVWAWDFNPAPPGIYQDIITLTVRAE